MNCAQAKSISILVFLQTLGILPAYRKTNGWWFHSPLQGEGRDKHPSFQVSLDGRSFHDWSTTNKGNIIDLVMAMTGICDVHNALKYLERIGEITFSAETIPAAVKNPCWEDVYETPLHSGPLRTYLHNRGISWETAYRYCCEIRYRLSNRDVDYYAIGFPNRAGGYELRNAMFKGAIPPKDITIVGEPEGRTCLVLEGFFDFLSTVELRWFQEERMSAIVLNSTAMVERAIPVLSKANRVICLLDGDSAGKKATKTLVRSSHAEDHSFLFYQQGFSDVNDYLRALLLRNNTSYKEAIDNGWLSIDYKA